MTESRTVPPSRKRSSTLLRAASSVWLMADPDAWKAVTADVAPFVILLSFT
jgi:hypothetical protein